MGTLYSTGFGSALLTVLFAVLGGPHWAAAAPAPDSEDDSLAKQIAREIDVPPVRNSVKPRVKPDDATLSSRPLGAYREDRGKTPLREATEKARDQLVTLVNEFKLKEEVLSPTDQATFQKDILHHQKEVARTLVKANAALVDLKEAGAKRGDEPAPRWRAHYDYLVIRYELEIAFLYEYTSALGSLRKDLPPLDKTEHTGWRLVSQDRMQGDVQGRKLAKQARANLEQLAKDYAGTPWEYLAQQSLAMPLGLTWQSDKLE